MKKAADLRAHLTEWVPDIASNPDKLQLFIEAGRVATRYGATLGFEYRYTLQILVTDFAEPADVLAVPLLVWIQTNQPDLLLDPERRDKAFAFRAEVIDHDKFDIEISLELSERVRVSATPAGYDCQHLGEPPLPDLSGPTNWSIYLNGELIADGQADG